MPEAPTPTPSHAAVPSVRDLLAVLVRAQKALRLYQGSSPVLERLEQDLYGGLAAWLEGGETLELGIGEFQILRGEDVVYESRDRNDSLAFLLYRDGIRRLSFLPGLERRELRALIETLARSTAAGNQQDDMVTLLWERDLSAIRYFAVEELSSEQSGPRLEEQLASPHGGEAASGGGGEAFSVRDVEQPVGHLPVDQCRLGEDEMAALRGELLREHETPFWERLVELAVELMLLESSEPDRRNLIHCLQAVIDQLLDQPDLQAVVRCADHLSSLARLFPEAQAVQRLAGETREALAAPERLARFLEGVVTQRTVEPAELTAFLVLLGPEAVDGVWPWVATMPTAPLRRALSNAWLAGGMRSVPGLLPHLIGADAEPPMPLLREGFHVLSKLPTEEILPHAPALMASPHEATRRELVRLVGRLDRAEAHALCVELLVDADAEVRGAALDALVHHERRELAQAMLERSLGAPGFPSFAAQEKRRLFRAVAKLAGDQALLWFVDCLERRESGWFEGAGARDLREAAAHGIRRIGTETARARLVELSRSSDRHVRAACLKELAQEEA